MSGKGLAGAVVADTELSLVDGLNGVLIYRGYNILDLGVNASFEETAYLLWNGKLPNSAELDTFKSEMAAMRGMSELVASILTQFPHNAHPMAVLRTAVSAMGTVDPDADNLDPANLQRQAMNLVATLPTIIAAWERIRTGKEPIAPRSDLSHAGNFLYMLTGSEPEAAAEAAMDAYLVCLADHGFNASTFATRVTFATISDMYSAVTSGVGTLKGDAHGRANQRAMEQFETAHNTGDVAQWFADFRADGGRIMGIGHRVYKVADPRGKILGPLAAKMSANSDEGHWYAVAETIETLAGQDAYFVDRSLYPNVDYYSSIVLYMIGLPIDQFTCAFAMSRMAGWSAHVLEQAANNRLIRPKAQYVGPTDLAYVAVEDRS
ncbi:MAG: citrate/2-methylcitrate synthase [Candidatus Promineifilaceae bacterium]